MIVFSNTLFWWDVLNRPGWAAGVRVSPEAEGVGMLPQQDFLRALDDGRLGFRRVRFTNYPSLGPLTFNDDWVEPSFSLYDHPPIIVYVRDPTADRASTAAELDHLLAPFHGSGVRAVASGGEGRVSTSRRFRACGSAS
jgi:hypothetical protein